MKLRYAPIIALALPIMAQDEHREVDAHEHGVSQMQIAIESGNVSIDLNAPGSDIVGFEYEAESNEDKNAIADAIQKLGQADELFAFNDEAHCRVSEIFAHLHNGDHDNHDSQEEHDDHDEHDGDAHSEFRAKYKFTCENADQINSLDFKFLTVFKNASEVEIDIISDHGARQAEVTKSSPVLEIKG